MSVWVNPQLRVYDENDAQLYSTTEFFEAEGGLAWHEIGRGARVVVPYIYTNADFIYDRGRRVFVTVLNSNTNLTHVICDFIVEATAIEERPLATGDGRVTVIVVSGRDQIKTLGEMPVGLRHISKYRKSTGAATAIDKTTLQMNPTDTAAFASMSLIGWTVELADGNWSEIIEHTAGGLLTIDPAWQVNVGDDEAAAPPAQAFTLYGAAVTETSGTYTDLKLAFLNWPTGGKNSAGWGIHSKGYTSTENGSFVAVGPESSVLKALQAIAAQSGEYFHRVPGEKKILWRRDVPQTANTLEDYPLELILPTSAGYNHSRYAAILPGAKLRYDGTDVVTRVKPIGGGSGDAALSLKDLPDGFTPMAGFTIDGEYLISDAAEDDGLYVSKDLRLDGIGVASDSAVSRQTAATALYRAARLYLQAHHDERLILECEVLSSIPIYPVTYVYVTHNRYALEERLMYVLESVVTYREGRVIYKLTLSDTIAPIMTDERLMAEAIRQTDTQIFYFNAPSRNSRMLDKARSASTGGESDHDPVTSGNAAIGVATGQVVSLVLAGPSGLEVAGGGLRLADSVAGVGLSVTNKVISINLAAASGLQLAADALGLGTPGTLSATTTAEVTANSHFHPITAISNGKATPGHLLKTDGLGDLTLRWLTADKVLTPEIETAAGGITLDPAAGIVYADGNLSFIGARQIVTDTGSLTLAPAQSLIIDPPDNVMQINGDVTMKTAHWSSGFLGTGWGMTYAGELDVRKIYADEMHVMAFIADTARVKLGAEYITPSLAFLSRNFTIPAVGLTGTLYVEDAPGLEEMPVFADGDWLLLRIIDRSGGGLLVGNVWGQVSGYSGLADGEQSWTFTTRSSTSTGQVFRRGATALDFGKSGDGWVWMTTLDPLGSPYLGITTWHGDNPYTEGNRTHRLRLGQLRGVTGVYEWGLQAGTATSSFVRFTDLRSEIHGSRLSLYAGDGAQLRVAAVDVLFYRTAVALDTLAPNADHSSLNVISTGATYYQAVDEGTSSPNLSDYVANGANTAGYVTLGLGNPTAFTGIYQTRIRATFVGSGFSNDTVRVYGQVFKSDELTPLTGEMLIQERTTNIASSTVTVTVPHDPAATVTDWNNARLRLRWEYVINANEEAIRLDPQTPSLAVGNPLPTGPDSGGDGLWVGNNGGLYKLRLGDPNGVSLRWTGTKLTINNNADSPVIELDNSGNSRFAGVMTIGTSGGIWQASGGSFAAPQSGIKLWNASGVGTIAAFNASSQNVVRMDNTGLTLRNPDNVYAQDHAIKWNTMAGATIGIVSSMQDVSGNRYMEIGLNPTYGFTELTAVGLQIRRDYNGVSEIYANAQTLSTQNISSLNISATGNIKANGGLVVGDVSASVPDTGVIRLKEKAVGVIVPPAAYGDFYLVDDGSGQKLYFRFDNGTVRLLASA